MVSSDGSAVTALLPRLISSNKIEGIPVLSRDGDKLGAVSAFLVDRFDGQVNFVIVAMGGLLGLGSSYHPVPWCLISFEPGRDGYVIAVDRAVLSSGPSFKGGTDQLFDAAFTGRILSYFAVAEPR